MATFTQLPQGQMALTGVKAHWFTPFLLNTDSGTLVIDPYTDNYDNGSAPWNVTLTSSEISYSGGVDTAGIPITSYTTGYNFHIEDVVTTNINDYDIFYDSANSSNQTTAVDIGVQSVDASGNPIGSPQIVLSDVNYLDQFHVSSRASGGTSYDLVYSTRVPGSGTEQINYQVYNTDGTPIASEGGTLENISTTNGESFGFGTLVPSTQPNTTYFYIRGSGFGLGGGNIGLKYELIGINGQATTSLTSILPPYPAQSTSQSLLQWTWDRLNPITAGGANLVAIQRYQYTDSSGAAQEDIDVHTMNAVTGGAVNDVIIPVVLGSSGLTETRLASGGFVIGYGDGPSNPSVLQEFDANGNAVGGPFSLPSNETQFNLDALPDGRVVVEYPSTTSGGNQLSYDIYDTRQAAVDVNLAADSSPTTAVGTSFNDVFYLGGAAGPDTIAGGGGTDFIVADQLAGSGTVLVDLKDGSVEKGSQVDAYISGIQGVTLGADPSVILGLTSGTDLLYGGSGADQFYNEGATDYIQGGTASNAVIGGSGTTIFYGNGGSDTMLGGTGENFMEAGATAGSTDVFYGGGGTDFVYGGPGATDLVGGSGTEVLSGGAGYNQLVGSDQSPSALNIFDGGSGTDVFYGGVGTNVLYEANGTDVFAGGAGTDYIYGGAGKSYVYGGTGTDVITTGAADQYVRAGVGQTVFNDTAANQTAGRLDQIDNFSGGKATDIYMATAAQGNTTFVAQNGGTAILTAVAGGTATIFAGGADVATAQAHTHFTT